jgi:biopolymer transport protein ExbD
MPATTLRNKPVINVTPLIDVLLVMLIIFMVAVPLRPHSLSAMLPSQQRAIANVINDQTLVVTVAPDHTLKLNSLTEDMGTVENSTRLRAFLVELFKQRKVNHVYRDEMVARIDVAEDSRIQKTVFIKAPRSLPYGSITRVLDGLKGAGADPVGLQLDDLK